MSHKNENVFISYSQDSDGHIDDVFELSQSLRKKAAVTVISDHPFITNPPPEGWPQWMSKQINNADIVLIICTENYYRRAEGKEKIGTGKGVKFEGSIITQSIYDNDSNNTKFIPVLLIKKSEQSLLEDEKQNLIKNIPTCLRGTNYFIVNISDLDSSKSYEKLLRQITEQHEYIVDPVSDKPVDLPPRNKKK